MIIDCIADLHGFYPDNLKGGDLLIVAGDLTRRDQPGEYIRFYSWLHKQNYRHYIFIAGNHDMSIQNGDIFTSPLDQTTYLQDSGTEFEGLKIWGSPWTLTFPEINPRCTAFTGNEKLLKSKFDMIPMDTDILITHGPPFTIFDQVVVKNDGVKNTGSRFLLDKARSLPNLKLFVFGHIHERYGMVEPQRLNDVKDAVLEREVKCAAFPYLVNCSHVDEYYNPVNEAIRIIL